MPPTRTPPARRPRRILSVVLAGMLVMIGAGGIVVFGAAEPASAAPVTIFSPLEIDPIDDSVWPFTGTGTPGDEVRVRVLTSPGGPDCITVADALGEWTCNVQFPFSGQTLSVQAISLNHTGPGQIEETKEYDVAVPPVIDENTDSAWVSTEFTDPYLQGTASPNATITGAVNGTACATVADALGNYTCTAFGANLPGDNTYFNNNFVRQQPVGLSFQSQPRSTWYIVDTTVNVPDSTLPFATGGLGGNVVTTDSTPEISGDPGTAEGQSEVIVYAYQFSATGTPPGWPPIPPAPGATQYCTAFTTPNGSWACSGTTPLPVNSVWVFGMSQIDLVGNGPPSPDAEFSIHILPPPPAPTIIEPILGYHSASTNIVHVSTTNVPSGVMYVREGATNLCASTPVAVPTFQCDTIPLSNGYHTIQVLQQDTYGTFSAPATRVVHIGPYPVKSVLKTLTFAFTIVGPDGEVGPDGLQAGDAITILAAGLPLGTAVTAEIHSDPVGLGSATIGQNGRLALATTIPDVGPGAHEIFVSASAPGYALSTMSSPLTVRQGKQLGEVSGPDEQVKELGTPADDADGTGPGDSGPGGSNAHGFTDPSVFGSSVESPFNAPAHAFAISPAGILLSGSIAVAFLLLVGLPAELLESTIRNNYDRAFGWLARLRRRIGRVVAPIGRLLANPWVGSGVTILAAAIMLGFADPDFGFNGASVRLVLAMILAVVAINIGISVVVMKVARRAFGVSAVLKPMPAALAIVAVSVLVSRLAGISPGFLFGIVLGVAYARELRLRDEARLGVLGVGLTIAAGLIAWLGYGLATAAASGPGFLNNLLIEALAAITLEALGTLLVALLPIEFLDGRTIFRWSKAAWLGLYALTAVVFLFVVVPLSDNWGSMSAPIFGWGTLFAVFAAVAIITWAVFRRRSRTTPSSPEAAAPRQRQRR